MRRVRRRREPGSARYDMVHVRVRVNAGEEIKCKEGRGEGRGDEKRRRTRGEEKKIEERRRTKETKGKKKKR